jgi:GNAT superfamily N-acetyltransferase
VMAATIAGLPDGATPAEVEIRSVAHATDLAAVRAVEVDTFGTPPEVAERFVGPSMLAEDHVRMFTAWIDGEPVGEASAYRTGTAVGIFGVGVLERARRRGIGTALTLTAARAFGDAADLTWLQPSAMAEGMYGRLGFRSVSRWEVWVRT